MPSINEDPRPSAEEILQLIRLDPIPSYLSASQYLPVFDAVVDLRQRGIEADWHVTLDSGWRCLGLAHAALQLHQDHASALRRTLSLQQLSDDFVDAAMEETFADENRAELLSELQASGDDIDPLDGVDTAMALIEDDPQFADISGEFDELRAQLTQIHQSAFDEISALVNTDTGDALLEALGAQREAAIGAMLEDNAMVLACLSRGLIAVAHAGFNLTSRNEETIGAFVATDYLGAVDRAIHRFAERLRKAQLELYVSCAQDSSEAAGRAGEHIVTEVERALPTFLRSQAVIRQAMEHLRDIGRNGDAEILGRRAARAGGLTREALGSHIAAARIMQEIASGFRSEAVTELIEKASATAFDGNLPDGRNTTINNLADRPNGEFVEVEGFVNTLEVLEPPGRNRVSRIGLLDPSSGATFQAVLLFAHLPHAGITQGAYIRLHGTVQSSSDLNEGEPAVEIDRLALAELAETCWRVAFLRSAEPWYEVWRSNANMIWSIGPHRPLDQQDVVALGAADLVYPPFVRE